MTAEYAKGGVGCGVDGPEGLVEWTGGGALERWAGVMTWAVFDGLLRRRRYCCCYLLPLLICS